MAKACPLCHSSDTFIKFPKRTIKKPGPKDFFCTSPYHGHYPNIHKCKECSLMFAAKELPYPKIYDYYEQVRDTRYTKEEAARIVTFARHLKHLKTLKPKGKLLDIGAYNGLFVSLAEKTGYKAIGLEPSSWGVDQGKKRYGVKLKKGILRSSSFSTKQFDIVTLWDVIEHLPHPQKDLRSINKFLKKDGIFAFCTMVTDTPITKIFGAKWPWFMYMHLYYFTRRNLKTMLKEAGFTDIKFRPHIRFVSLRYLVPRLPLIPTKIKHFSVKIIRKLKMEGVIIPFYLGDLIDVYAKKP